MNNKYGKTVIPVIGLQVHGQLEEFSHPGTAQETFLPLILTSQLFSPWERSLTAAEAQQVTSRGTPTNPRPASPRHGSRGVCAATVGAKARAAP